MTKLDEFRASYPQYKDVADDKLAGALYEWGYADKMDRREFDARIGLKPYDTTLEATGKALGNVPERLSRGVGGIQQMIGETGEETARQIEEGGGGMLDFTGMTPEERKAAADRARAQGVELTEAGKARVAEADAGMTPIDLPAGLSTAKVVSGAIGSTAEMLPALTMSLLMRSPVPAMAGIGAQVGGDAYATGRAEGLSPEDARSYAALYAAAEGLPEALPLGVLLKPGSTFLTRTVKGALAEGVQETFTEALQIAVDQGYIEPDMTWGEVKERLKDAAVIGAVAGPLMAAYSHPVGAAVEKGYGAAAQVAVNVKEKGDRLIRDFMPQTFRTGPDKRTGPTMLDRVNAALRKRGFAPLESINDTPLHGETIDQTRYGEVIPPEPEVEMPPLGPEPVTIDAQTVEQENAPRLPPPRTVSDKPVKQGSLSSDIATIVEEEATAAGVDPGTMKRIAWIESGGDPSAQNPNSSAGGLFQQTDANAEDYGVADRKDARQSAKGAAEFAADNIAFLTKALGREPTPGEIYLAHQQGPGGAKKLLTADQNAKAADIVGEDQVLLNGGTPDMTVGEFTALWTSKMEGDGPATAPGRPSEAGPVMLAEGETSETAKPSTPIEGISLEERGQTAPPEVTAVGRMSTPSKPVELDVAPDLDKPAMDVLRADINPNPTDAQMAHVRWKGRDISIETAKGMERSGTAPDGSKWSVTMPADYGRIKGTVGMDGEQIDIYVGPKPESDRIFIVDQVDLDTGKPDEHKVIAGVETLDEAKLLYDSGFSDGKGAQRRANVTEIDEETFDRWLDEGDTTKPYKAVKELKAKKGKKEAAPVDIVKFLAANGGLVDYKGELKALDLRKAFVPGVGKLMRETGMKLDRARELAEEAGYIGKAGDYQTTTVADLLDAIERNQRGERVYARADVGRAEARKEEQNAGKNSREAAVREELESVMAEYGANLLPGEVDQVLELIADGMWPEEALVEVIERNALAAEAEFIQGETAKDDTDVPFEVAGEDRTGEPPLGEGERPGPTEEPGRGAAPPRRKSRGRKQAGNGSEGTPAEGAFERIDDDAANDAIRELIAAKKKPKEPTVEKGAEGKPQTVIPGAERISDKKLAERRAEAPLRPKVVQKDVGGLFGEDHLQDELFGMGGSTSALRGDMPMPKYVPTYRAKGVPQRVDAFQLNEKTIETPPLDKPQRREGVRTLLEQIIGTRLYYGKIKGKSRLGFYRRSNSEVRIKDYDDIEVMAHEAAHYLDMHYNQKGRFSALLKNPVLAAEVSQVSYTSKPSNVKKEGFAEFVRLWSTQHAEAVARTPKFTVAFEAELAKDPKLQKQMHAFQEAAHRWYLQGAHAQLRAKSGEEYTPSETIMRFMQSYPAERFRQQTLDKIHAAKVVERTTQGGLNDATRSAFKQFQMINGAESLHDSVIRDGTPQLEPDGTFSFSGKGLSAVFWPAAKHGYKRFDLLMDYFKARRAQELKAQKRENLFTKQEIDAGLALVEKYPEFADVFADYQAFNSRMLDFFEQMGLISTEAREAFAEANSNYVPFHRVIQQIEEGGDTAGTGPIGKRLSGSTANTKDIAVNIVEGLFTNIRGALYARAKATLYDQIKSSQDGSLFAVPIGTDTKKVQAHIDDMARKVAKVMDDLGVGQQAGIKGDDIVDALDRDRRLLDFWLIGQPPKTDGDTYIDSAIIDGKRVYFEVREPLLVDMLTGMGGMKSGFVLKQLFRVKNFQTRTITSMLQFLGPNAWRDTLGAAAMSKNSFIPVADTIIGMIHAVRDTPLMKDFRQHGGGYGTRVEARTQERRSRAALDLPSRDMWQRAAKLLAGYDRFVSAFEYGSRVGDYRRATMAGKTKLQAAWEAREISTDFAKIGRNEFWAKFVRTVPFMNAALQSLDRMATEMSEIDGEMKGRNLLKAEKLRSKFVITGGIVTLMTLILWMLNNDDERYQGLTTDEKARFWWLFIPGLDTPIKIPRPYDVGTIFATIPETIANYVKDKDGPEAAKAIMFAVMQTLNIGDYPGIFQPVIEAKANKDWRGSSIVPARLADMPPELQFTDRTPIIYRKLGETLGVSPLVAQHYTKGYLNYVEQILSDTSEALLWNSAQWGERPFARGPGDWIGHAFVGTRVPYRTKWTEGYYDLRARASGMRAAVSMLEAESVRDPTALNRVYGDKIKATLASLDTAFNAIDRAFADQDTILSSIKYSKALKADEKERRIEAYYEQKNRALGQFYKQVKTELDRIERGLSK